MQCIPCDSRSTSTLRITLRKALQQNFVYGPSFCNLWMHGDINILTNCTNMLPVISTQSSKIKRHGDSVLLASMCKGTDMVFTLVVYSTTKRRSTGNRTNASNLGLNYRNIAREMKSKPSLLFHKAAAQLLRGLSRLGSARTQHLSGRKLNLKTV